MKSKFYQKVLTYRTDQWNLVKYLTIIRSDKSNVKHLDTTVTLDIIVQFYNIFRKIFIYCWVGILSIRRQTCQCRDGSNNSKQHSTDYNIV